MTSNAATANSTAAFARPLDAAAIREHLPADLGSALDIETVEVTGSTNTDLLQRARQQAFVRPCLRTALEQTAGRGRQGRAWQSKPGGRRGSALLFSLALPTTSTAPAPVTLASGVTIAEQLRAARVPVQLKWPNDILLEGRKLAGILTELAIDRDGKRTLVIGVGLNLWIDPSAMSAVGPAGMTAAALSERIALSELAGTRETWLALLAAAVVNAVREFEAAGFAAFRARYEDLFAYWGRKVVVVERGAPSLNGVACGIAGDGRLLIETDAGVQEVSSGDVSLRVTA
jgi:BirA family biotin operon repressor/biotin-[acetyl-CoA-carboxylase] ligase